MKNWAFIINIPNVGSIAYAKAYFEKTGIVNPLTANPYTQEEITAIVKGAKEECESYTFDLPENAVLGMGDFWYDADNAAAIVSHPDPLTMDANGVFTTADGKTVATPIA